MRFSFYQRIVSTTLAAVFTATSAGLPQLAQANIWQERRDAQLAMVPAGFQGLPALQSSPIKAAAARVLSPRLEARVANPKQKKLRSAIAALPASLGSVRDVSVATKADAPILIHIQDIHENFEAQKNIKDLIAGLAASNMFDFVALEGAFGVVETAPLRSFPSPAILKKVVERMLAENKLDGPVVAALTIPGAAPLLMGVDDRVAYRSNVAAYRRSRAGQAALEKRLADIEQRLDATKRASLNPALAALDRTVTAHRAEKMSLGDYAETLAAVAPSVPDSVAMFLKAAKLEKSLNFDRVETERGRLLEQLVRRLSAADSRELINLSSAFREGALSHAQFYSSLKSLCERVGLPLTATPAMDAYIRYVVVADSIDAEEMLTALDEMERDAYARLAASPVEKNLVAQSRLALQLHRLLAFALTPDEWRRYESERASALALGFSQNELEPYERFYADAQTRDRAMVANTLKAARERQARVVVLVAGGFHSTGVKRHAKDAGFSVITFAPRVTQVDDASGSAYLSVFAQERTPLEKLVAGQPLFLAKERLLPQDELDAGLCAYAAFLRDAPTGEQMALKVWRDDVTAWLKAFASRLGLKIKDVWSDASNVRVKGTVRSEAFEIVLSGDEDRIKKVVLDRPFWETVALWVARPVVLSLLTLITPAAYVWTLPHTTALLVGVVFALRHRKPGVFWRTVMGTAYTELVGIETTGFFLSFGAHMLHNYFIIASTLSVINPGANSLLKRISQLVSRLPLTAINGNAEESYFAPRTNNYKTIVNALPVVKLVGKEIDLTVQEAYRTDLSNEELDAEAEKFEATRKSTYEQLMKQQEYDLVEGFTFATMQIQKMIASMREQRIPYPIALAQKIQELDAAEKDKPDMTRGLMIGALNAIRERTQPQELMEAQEKRPDRTPDDVLEANVPDEFVLMVTKSNLSQSKNILRRYRRQIKAVIIDGPLAGHWATVEAKDMGIPVLANFQEAVFSKFNDGDLVTVNVYNQKIIRNPTPAMVTKINDDIDKYAALFETVEAERAFPTVTRDGVTVPIYYELSGSLSSNQINEINEVAGGDIGLDRMEYRFETKDLSEDALVKEFLKNAMDLQGLIRRVRAIDRRPPDPSRAQDRDKATVFDGLPGGDLAELHWLLDTDTGRQNMMKLARVLLRVQQHLILNGSSQRIQFFVPMVETNDQVDRVLELLQRAANGLTKTRIEDGGLDPTLNVTLDFGVMIETPVEEGELNKILGRPEVKFVSIGSRDMMDFTGTSLTTDQTYLREFAKVITVADKYRKPVSICGVNAPNEELIVFALAVPTKNGTVPSFTMDLHAMAFIKAMLRVVNRRQLQSSFSDLVEMVVNDPLERLPQPAQEKMQNALTARIQSKVGEIRGLVEAAADANPIYEEALHVAKMQHGLVATQEDFDTKAFRHAKRIRRVTPIGDAKGHVPSRKARKIEYDFSLANLSGRHVLAAMSLTAQNGNRVMLYLFRIAQTYWVRYMLGRDTRRNYVVVAAEGTRLGKLRQSVFALLSRFGLGDEERQVALLSIESPEGLLHSDKFGTLAGSLYGEPTEDRLALRHLPDANVVKVVVGLELRHLKLNQLITQNRIRNGDGINLKGLAESLVRNARRLMGRSLAVGIQLREHHEGAIRTLIKELGIRETYEQIHDAMQKSSRGWEEFRSPGENVLRIYNYDDWSFGLSMHFTSGLDMYLGIGGTPEALMSAALVGKLGGQMAVSLVPSQNKATFTFVEKALFKLHKIKSRSHVITSENLVGTNPENTAVSIAVLRDFTMEDKTVVKGPVMLENGDVDVHVIWVSKGEVLPFKITYETSVSELLTKQNITPLDIEDLIMLTIAYAEFGKLNEAQSVIDREIRPLPAADKARFEIEALQLYVTAMRTLVSEPGETTVVSENSLLLLERALKIVQDKKLDTLEKELRLQEKIRRINYALRDIYLSEAEQAAKRAEVNLTNRALRASYRAFDRSERGFETMTRHHRIQLRPLLQIYEDAIHRQTATYGQPQLYIKIREAGEVWKNFMVESHSAPNDDVQSKLKAYDILLKAKGSSLWAVFMHATVLVNEPLDVQARVLQFFNEEREARQFVEKMNAPQAIRRMSDKDIQDKMHSLIKKALARHTWQTNGLPAIRSDLMFLRESIRELSSRVEGRERAQTTFPLLVLAALAKADMMVLLGAPERRLAYMLEAESYASIIAAHPLLFSKSPVALLFDFRLLYAWLAETTKEKKYQDKADLYQRITFGAKELHDFLASIEHKDGEREFSDDVIRDVHEPKRFAHLHDRFRPSSDPVMQSLPVYIARLLGARDPLVWVRPGYVMEIAAALPLLVFVTGASWIIAVYAILHAVVWAAAEIRTNVSETGPPHLFSRTLKRAVWHLLAFTPYIVVGAYAAQPESLKSLIFAGWAIAGIWHAMFDEIQLRRETRLTPDQTKIYNQVLTQLSQRDKKSIFGMNVGVRAIRSVARNAAKAGARSWKTVVAEGLEQSRDGVYSGFLNNDSDEQWAALDTVMKQLNDQARARKGERVMSPLLLALMPQMDSMATKRRLDEYRDKYPWVLLVTQTLNRDVKPRDGGHQYYYEDLFGAFSNNRKLSDSYRETLRMLAASQVPGVRLLQFNMPSADVEFVGAENILNAILLLLPLEKGQGVLIDVQSALLAAKHA